LDAPDPLLALLRRYQAELKAFDDARASDGITDEDWDRIAQDTWVGTQDEIIQSEPPATTAAGALLALDHALQSEDLFAERSESVDLQMLWQLIKSARDYIARPKSHFRRCASDVVKDEVAKSGAGMGRITQQVRLSQTDSLVPTVIRDESSA